VIHRARPAASYQITSIDVIEGILRSALTRGTPSTSVVARVGVVSSRNGADEHSDRGVEREHGERAGRFLERTDDDRDVVGRDRV
jgi:hypothetical protein